MFTRCPNQAQVPLVQIAHGRHKSNMLTGLTPIGQMLAKRFRCTN
jgi:hypothetical protein